MATLNTACGWVDTDPSSILIALGIGVTRYGITQIITCMNDLCDFAPQVIGSVQDLLDQYTSAQEKMVELNSGSDGKTLIKADVLEWEAAAPGASYSPEREMTRVREQLMLFFAACPICGGEGYINGVTSLVRS
jgi:hypothetical protein